LCFQGISLSIDQFKGVIEALPQIEASLAAKDISIPRPQYGGGDNTATSLVKTEEAQNDEHEDDEEPEVPQEASKGRLEKFMMSKGNHEATSDEEE